MSATIKDIAKKVGVNPSTVSRVINGTASISEVTKGKILEAMRELDYHPNVAARSLVNGNTFTIALVIDAKNADAFSNAFFIQSVSAIERVSQERGYNLLITNNANCTNNNTVNSLILEHKVDGIILPVSIIDDSLLELLKNSGMPFVILGEPENKSDYITWVDIDNEEGSRKAVMHLLKMGYSSPALLVENKGTMFEKQRILGYRDALKNEMSSYVFEISKGPNDVVDAVEKIVSDSIKIDSVICTNNIVAFNVLKELKRRDISVPREVGIISFDNYPLSEYLEPALSVVDVDTYKMGEKAASVLFEKIKGAIPSDVSFRIPTEIIERESTKK